MALDHKSFTENLKASADYLVPLHRDFRKDFEFYALRQWRESDRKKLQEEMRPALVLDRTRPLIEAIVGAEATNRYVPKFWGFNVETEDVDRIAAEVFNLLYTHVRKHGSIEFHETMAFRDDNICGLGVTETFLDYHRNPDGQILTRRVPVFNVGWDTSAVEPNWLDANWAYVFKDLPEEEFEALFPEGADMLPEIREESRGSRPGFMTRTLQRLPGRQYERENEQALTSLLQGYDSRARTVRVWDYQYREKVRKDRILLPNGESLWLYSDETDDFMKKERESRARADAQLAADGQAPLPMPEVIPNIPTYVYRRCLIAGDEVLQEEVLPFPSFTLLFMTGNEDWSGYGTSESSRKYTFGSMKPMRDPQDLRNKFFSQAVHIWNTNPKGLLIYEQGLFPSDERAAEVWARPDGRIPVEDGALSTARPRLMHFKPGNSFSGIEPMFAQASNAVHEGAGVNPNYFAGQAGDIRRAAYSSVDLLQKQNLAALSQTFDNLRLYRKEHAGLVMEMMRAYVSDRQINRILGPKYQGMVPLVRQQSISDYDILVEEAPATESPAHEIFTAFMQNLPSLLQMGFPVPPSAFKYLTPFFPADVADEWVKMVEQFYQNPPQQQQPQSQ